ncbi:MAG: nicotinate-nucleotide adenylyltransferase [Kiritimatiellales bacterium]|nr:nicotinate-nucleotide adenylyltransferase [Kiritimatiellales bacterium]MCF7863198.1 nicotinate-nucleotide adenylyltransferase [Kiritimatiellales bacterium]
MMESYPAQRRVGIMGGSFDPVHMGHLVIAQDAVERLELAELVFIPAAIPPHKQHLLQVEPKHRLNMLRLAVEADIRFSVSDIEVERGGVSYTVDTIRALKEKYPKDELFLIVGSDTLVDLHNWHRIDELLAQCQVATFLRPGEAELEEIQRKIGLSGEQKQRLLANVVETHRIGISSTEIRMRVAEGMGIRYLVPPEVEMYIYEHGLYRG